MRLWEPPTDNPPMRPLICLLACASLLVACTLPSSLASEQVGAGPASSIDLDVDPPEVSHVRVQESVVWKTYLVEGETAGAIRSSLNRNGPYSPSDRRRVDALTRWGLHWSFRYDEEPDGCRLAAATIEVVVQVEMPELRDAERLAPSVWERWEAYSEALRAHEQGHVDQVLRGAGSLQAAFDTAGAMESCSELGRYLHDLGQAYVQALAAADAHYDARTGHGASQGAVFP